MDIKTLINRLPKTTADRKVPDLVLLGDDTAVQPATLLDLCFDRRKDSVPFYAAYILEHVATYHPERFAPVLNTMFTRLAEQKNFSCQRHFTKILMAVTHPKAPKCYKQVYAQTNRELFVETVFSWFIDPITPVAVQANCMDILFNASKEFDWVAEELKQQVTFLMREGPASIQSRGRKILRKLKNAG